MENSINFSKAYPLSILIAEPSHDSQSSANDILIQMGYKPELVTTSREMLNMTSQKSYDVVLMDIRMPEAEDILATRLTDRDNRRPIFIAMTVSGRSNFREMFLSEGMDHLISKPLDPAELSLQLMACSVLSGNRRIRS
ncbi:MAG TPA: response regulator [Puia sp.]|jgi:CheY-like chemotaxis protein|nr:response regulator [Puia sp.]